MLSLVDMIAQHDLQHEIRKAREANLSATDIRAVNLSAISPPLGTACGIIHDHDCFEKDFSSIEGRLITLWAYLQLPEDRARKDSHNIKRHRKAKALLGMGNGHSPLRHELTPEDVDDEPEFIIRMC